MIHNVSSHTLNLVLDSWRWSLKIYNRLTIKSLLNIIPWKSMPLLSYKHIFTVYLIYIYIYIYIRHNGPIRRTDKINPQLFYYWCNNQVVSENWKYHCSDHLIRKSFTSTKQIVVLECRFYDLEQMTRLNAIWINWILEFEQEGGSDQIAVKIAREKPDYYISKDDIVRSHRYTSC